MSAQARTGRVNLDTAAKDPGLRAFELVHAVEGELGSRQIPGGRAGL